MIGIEHIGIYIPESRTDSKTLMSKFGIDESFLNNKTGFLHLAKKNISDETSDLCRKAFRDLKCKTKISEEEIECIVVVTQNPDAKGLPHTSGILHDKLNLPASCAAFDISLGCSGYVYGLSIIQAFMLSNNFSKGVLFTADPYSKIIDDNDKNTSLLFGDAATATLISSSPQWTTGRFLFGSHGKEHSAIQIDDSSGKLEMNGRSVFTFSATVVPDNIRQMLSANNITTDDVDSFILHQGSRYIVSTIQKKLGVEPAKVPFDADSYGNTVSSSIPLLLSKQSSNAKIIVIAGFGVGLSWGSTILKRVEVK